MSSYDDPASPDTRSWKRRLRDRVRDRLFRRARRMPLRQVAMWKLWQWLSASNPGAWWPVHPSSVIIHPERIKLGEGSRPGYSAACYIQANNGIEIGDRVGIAAGVSIISANHDPYNMREHIDAPPIKIGNFCWLGTRAVILPGVELGEHVVVGAGAVVTKSFPDRAVVAGVPAKVIYYLKEEPDGGAGESAGGIERAGEAGGPTAAGRAAQQESSGPPAEDEGSVEKGETGPPADDEDSGYVDGEER